MKRVAMTTYWNTETAFWFTSLIFKSSTLNKLFFLIRDGNISSNAHWVATGVSLRWSDRRFVGVSSVGGRVNTYSNGWVCQNVQRLLFLFSSRDGHVGVVKYGPLTDSRRVVQGALPGTSSYIRWYYTMLNNFGMHIAAVSLIGHHCCLFNVFSLIRYCVYVFEIQLLVVRFNEWHRNYNLKHNNQCTVLTTGAKTQPCIRGSNNLPTTLMYSEISV